jgi:hypothetical protein
MKKLNKEIVTEEKIELMKPYQREFQGIVSLFANLKFRFFDAQAIMKWEGGVIVNKREIVLYNDQVKDDFTPYSEKSSKEEEEVVRIIETIFSEINFKTLPNSLEKWKNAEIMLTVSRRLKTFDSNPYGDKLNSFFDN